MELRFKLEVSDGVSSYSSLFSRKRSIQLSAIENADTQFGPDAPFGPFYRLVVYPPSETEVRPIVINVKVFSKQDLNVLLDILGPKFKGHRRFSIFNRTHRE